jgi:probable HAF family extracellular repeat protein
MSLHPVRCRRVAPVLVAVAGLAGAAPAFAQASFRGLGTLGDFIGYPESHAYAMSADGSTIVGWTTSPHGYQAFRWTQAEGMVGLGFVRGRSDTFDDGSAAYGVSADGSVIVGQSANGVYEEGGVPFRWTPATGMVPLTSTYGVAYGVTDDGSFVTGGVIVSGAGGLQAFRWTPAGGLVRFERLPDGSLPPDAFTFHDGSFVWCTVAGYPCTRDLTYRWAPQEGWTMYPPEFGLISGFTRDGRIRIGNDCQPPAYRWKETEGFSRLGTIAGCLDNGTSGFGGASADGSLIVGLANIAPYDCIGVGYIWDAQHGMRNLRQALIDEYGLSEVGSWGRLFPSGVSSDGTVICGTGDGPDGTFQAWVAHLPGVGGGCAADFTADRTLNIQDFLAFLQAFATADTRADFDHDGAVNLGDFLAYLSAFAGGCP